MMDFLGSPVLTNVLLGIVIFLLFFIEKHVAPMR
jgi:hypothetical protein